MQTKKNNVVSLVWQAEKPETTAVRVERQIKEAVLDGQLSPGDVLGSEGDLATQFSVSRLPIREALGRLRALGVVDIRTGAGGGVRIASGNPTPAVEALAIQLQLAGVTPAEVFDAQFAIETVALPLAAKAATESDLLAIEAAIDAAQALVNESDDFTRASLVVHQAMVDAAHNHVLSATMRAIIYVLYRPVNEGTTPAIARGVIEHHRSLLAAIRDKDDDRVRQVLLPFLERVRQSFFAKKANDSGSSK